MLEYGTCLDNTTCASHAWSQSAHFNSGLFHGCLSIQFCTFHPCLLRHRACNMLNSLQNRAKLNRQKLVKLHGAQPKCDQVDAWTHGS